MTSPPLGPLSSPIGCCKGQKGPWRRPPAGRVIAQPVRTRKRQAGRHGAGKRVAVTTTRNTELGGRQICSGWAGPTGKGVTYELTLKPGRKSKHCIRQTLGWMGSKTVQRGYGKGAFTFNLGLESVGEAGRARLTVRASGTGGCRVGAGRL